MKANARRLVLIALVALVAAGCGQKRTRERTDSSGNSARDLSEAAAEMKRNPFVNKDVGNALQAMSKVAAQSENVTITPVDFRALRDLLPETAAGLKRKSLEGQKEMGISTASADYGDEGGNASLHVKITDPGQMRAMLAGGAAMALSLDMEKETGDGFERNVTLQGLRVHERKSGDNGDMNTLVGERFIVEINGYNVKPEQLRSALESLPLKKLAGMKDDGVETAK